MLRGKRFLGFLIVFLMCTSAAPAHGRFLRALFGGVARRVSRRVNRRGARRANNSFLLPLQNQFFGNGFGNGFGFCNNGVGGLNNFGLHGDFSRFGGSSFINPALAASLGGFGHCVNNGVDPGFPTNGQVNPNAASFADGGGGISPDELRKCDALGKEPCTQGPNWACSTELAKNWSVDVTGAGNCAAVNLKVALCKVGIKDDQWRTAVNSTNTACWVPANVSGAPVADFSKAASNMIPGQVVVVLNDDFGADKVQNWVDSKQPNSSVVQRFQRKGKADVLLLSTTPGNESALCSAARNWNSGVVQSCAPNIFPAPSGNWASQSAAGSGSGYDGSTGGGGSYY